MATIMTHSQELFSRAQQVMTGGVNSPVRAFKGVGGTPLFIAKGNGAYLFDVDDNRYIDYVGSWGPLILGHAHPEVIAAVQKTAANGLSFGAPCELEIQLAEKITQLMPSIEMVRMVSSGTEAVMTAIRLARGYTKRDKILKFVGCYHGHCDSLLVKAGSGVLTLGIPDSPGIPDDFTKHTLLADYNNLEQVKKIFARYGHEIAAVFVEPIAANMNCVLPVPGFLSGLREVCDQYQSLLIFDEVITGFRVALGGAQTYYDVTPDLTTLGKIIGGGMPVGAVGGRKQIMEYLAPLGPVYQAGTLSGNPVAMAAGLATLNQISQTNFYNTLEQSCQQLACGLKDAAKRAGIALTIVNIGSLFGLFFTNDVTITHFSQVQNCNIEQFRHFFHKMLDAGVYFAPSMYEVGFISTAHSATDIDFTLSAAEKIFNGMSS